MPSLLQCLLACVLWLHWASARLVIETPCTCTVLEETSVAPYTCITTMSVVNDGDTEVLRAISSGQNTLHGNIIRIYSHTETFPAHSRTANAVVVEWQCDAQNASLVLFLNALEATPLNFAVASAEPPSQLSAPTQRCDGSRCGVARRCPIGFSATPSGELDDATTSQCVSVGDTTHSFVPAFVNGTVEPRAGFHEFTCGRYGREVLLANGTTRNADNLNSLFREALRTIQSTLLDDGFEATPSDERPFLGRLVRQCMDFASSHTRAQTLFVAAVQEQAVACNALVAAGAIETLVARCGVLNSLTLKLPLAAELRKGRFAPTLDGPTLTLQLNNPDFIEYVFGYAVGTAAWTQIFTASFQMLGVSSISTSMARYKALVASLKPVWQNASAIFNAFLANPALSFAPEYPASRQWANFTRYTLDQAQSQSGTFNLSLFVNELYGTTPPPAFLAALHVGTFNSTLLLPTLAQLMNPALRDSLQDYYGLGSVMSHLLVNSDLDLYFSTAVPAPATFEYTPDAECIAGVAARSIKMPVARKHRLEEMLMGAARRDVTPPPIEACPGANSEPTAVNLAGYTLHQCAVLLLVNGGNPLKVNPLTNAYKLGGDFAPWTMNPLLRRLERRGAFAGFTQLVAQIRQTLLDLLDQSTGLTQSQHDNIAQKIASSSVDYRTATQRFSVIPNVFSENFHRTLLQTGAWWYQSTFKCVADTATNCVDTVPATVATQNAQFIVLSQATVEAPPAISLFPSLLLPPNFDATHWTTPLNIETSPLAQLIAHEFGHFATMRATVLRGDGASVRWQSSEELATTNATAQCLRAFYEAQTSRFNVTQRFTTTAELEADHVALRVLLEMATRRHTAANITGDTRLAELRHLFIAFAQPWCDRSDEARQRAAAGAAWPLDEFRASVTPLFFDEFWEAFGVVRPLEVPRCGGLGV